MEMKTSGSGRIVEGIYTIKLKIKFIKNAHSIMIIIFIDYLGPYKLSC